VACDFGHHAILLDVKANFAKRGTPIQSQNSHGSSLIVVLEKSSAGQQHADTAHPLALLRPRRKRPHSRAAHRPWPHSDAAQHNTAAVKVSRMMIAPPVLRRLLLSGIGHQFGTNSATISAKRSVRPSAQRYCIATVRPAVDGGRQEVQPLRPSGRDYDRTRTSL
jgi:hypothetical protein